MLIVLLVTIGLMVVPARVFGQVQEAKIENQAPERDAGFGRSVALENNRLVVGAMAV